MTEVLHGDHDMNFDAADNVAPPKANTQPVGQKILPAATHFGKTILTNNSLIPFSDNYYDDDVGNSLESDSDNYKTSTPTKRKNKQRKHKASSVNNNSPGKQNKRPRRKQTNYK